MKRLASFVPPYILTATVLSLTSIQGCDHPTVAQRAPLTIEWAEVEPGSPARHLFDKNDVVLDLPVRSSILVEGTVFGFVPGWTNSNGRPQPDGLSFRPNKSDGDKFTEWTAARIDKECALIVGDQVWTQAYVKGALSGVTQLDVPAKIHSREIRELVEGAKHWVK